MAKQGRQQLEAQLAQERAQAGQRTARAGWAAPVAPGSSAPASIDGGDDD